MKNSAISVQIAGVTNLQRSLGQMRTEILPVAKEVIYAEAQNILSDSREIVPFLRGVLSSSGRVHEPVMYSDSVLVEVSYGGAAAPYAEVQHENMEFAHAPGREALYLYTPVEEARKDFGGRLKSRIERLLAQRATFAVANKDSNGDS